MLVVTDGKFSCELKHTIISSYVLQTDREIFTSEAQILLLIIGMSQFMPSVKRNTVLAD
jgi:hypothetical protein